MCGGSSSQEDSALDGRERNNSSSHECFRLLHCVWAKGLLWMSCKWSVFIHLRPYQNYYGDKLEEILILQILNLPSLHLKTAREKVWGIKWSYQTTVTPGCPEVLVFHSGGCGFEEYSSECVRPCSDGTLLRPPKTFRLTHLAFHLLALLSGLCKNQIMGFSSWDGDFLQTPGSQQVFPSSQLCMAYPKRRSCIIQHLKWFEFSSAAGDDWPTVQLTFQNGQIQVFMMSLLII